MNKMTGIIIILGSFFISLKDVWKDVEFRILFVLIVLLLLTGAIFYSEVEGYDLIDSLYFSVMIMSTIGYGELTLSTSTAKIFTIVYAFVSIGVFITIGSKVVLLFVERSKVSQKKIKEWERSRKIRRQQRKSSERKNP
ncbi:MAG: two pore domain potassium channel family protein [Bacteroidetes bacterium]|nr:two pore domain potassium channel family protein [Bacteroidota bacterium]